MTHDKPHGFQMLSLEILYCCRVGFDLLVSQPTCSSHELQPQENKYNSISMINLSHKNMSQKMYALVVTNCGSSVL